MRLLKFIWLIASVLAARPLAGQPLLGSSKIAEIEHLITGEMSSQRIPGMSIAIGKGTEIWTNGYGFADLENFVPATSSTVYRTASVAKPMTAVGAMQLVGAGKLDLDAPIQTYLPSYPQKQWSVTTRQLLGHIGGIRAYRDGAEASLTRHYDGLRAGLGVFENDPLAYEPGTRYLYSTFGYVLVGAVIEAAAGIPYDVYMLEKVFQPAGMKSTQQDDVYRIIASRSRGYQRMADGEVRNSALHDTSYKVPAGGLVSSAGDLVRFALALDSGKLLKPESLPLLFESLQTRDGKRTGYGLGWGIEERNGVRRLLHNGGQAGVSTTLIYLPEQHAAIGMMFNLENVQMKRLADRLIEILLQ